MTPEIDLLVELATKVPGVRGARLTGGGFGGAVVVLADPIAAPNAARTIADEYAKRTDRQASSLLSLVNA